MSAHEAMIATIMTTRHQLGDHQQMSHEALRRQHAVKDERVSAVIIMMAEGVKPTKIADRLGIPRSDIHGLIRKAQRRINQRERARMKRQAAKAGK